MSDALGTMDELATYAGAAGELLSGLTANVALGPAGGTLFGAAAGALGTLSAVTGGTALLLGGLNTVSALARARSDRHLLRRVRRSVNQAVGTAQRLAGRGISPRLAFGIGLTTSGATQNTLDEILNAGRDDTLSESLSTGPTVPVAAANRPFNPATEALIQQSGADPRAVRELSFGLRNPRTTRARSQLLDALRSQQFRSIFSTRIPAPISGAVPGPFARTRRAV